MAHEAEGLQYAINMMRISIGKVLEKESTGITILRTAVDVVLAPTRSLQQEPALSEGDESSLNDSNYEYSEGDEDATHPPAPAYTLAEPARVSIPALSSLQNRVIEVSRPPILSKKRAITQSRTPSAHSVHFGSPVSKRVRLTEQGGTPSSTMRASKENKEEKEKKEKKEKKGKKGKKGKKEKMEKKEKKEKMKKKEKKEKVQKAKKV